MSKFLRLRPRPRLLTLDGLLLHGYIADQETLNYIKEMIAEANPTSEGEGND